MVTKRTLVYGDFFINGGYNSRAVEKILQEEE
jgi:hypothetical protein